MRHLLGGKPLILLLTGSSLPIGLAGGLDAIMISFGILSWCDVSSPDKPWCMD